MTDTAKAKQTRMGCLTFLALVVILAIVISVLGGKGPKKPGECEGPAFKSAAACAEIAHELKAAEKPSAAYAGTYIACVEKIKSASECLLSVDEACKAAELSEEVCAHGQEQGEAGEKAAKHLETLAHEEERGEAIARGAAKAFGE